MVQLSEQKSMILKKDQIARSISLVPKFDEKEFVKNFVMFEKVAKSSSSSSFISDCTIDNT